MRRFRMPDSGLTQEVITFPSAISLDHAESNIARAYVYRHGRLGERPVVVWVPGQYVARPQGFSVWQPGQWVQQPDGRYFWNPGHWS